MYRMQYFLLRNWTQFVPVSCNPVTGNVYAPCEDNLNMCVCVCLGGGFPFTARQNICCRRKCIGASYTMVVSCWSSWPFSGGRPNLWKKSSHLSVFIRSSCNQTEISISSYQKQMTRLLSVLQQKGQYYQMHIKHTPRSGGFCPVAKSRSSMLVIINTKKAPFW